MMGLFPHGQTGCGLVWSVFCQARNLSRFSRLSAYARVLEAEEIVMIIAAGFIAGGILAWVAAQSIG